MNGMIQSRGEQFSQSGGNSDVWGGVCCTACCGVGFRINIGVVAIGDLGAYGGIEPMVKA